MPNGVEVLAVLSGGIPKIPGPRRTPPPSAPNGVVRPPGPGEPPKARARTPLNPSPVRPSPNVSRPGRAAVLRPASGPFEARSPAANPVKAAPAAALVRRVAEVVQSAAAGSGNSVRLSLRPEHLGDLWVELSVAGSRLRGRLRTETEAAKTLLLAHLDELRDALAALGIRLSDLQVEVGGSGRDGAAAAGGEPDGKPEEEEAGAAPRSLRRQRIDVQA